jgi:hypothetical protein
MNTRKRQPLNDALAEKFVYGEQKTAAIETPQTPEKNTTSETKKRTKEKNASPVVDKSQEKETTLLDKLTIEPKAATVRLTVDLSEAMHKKLSILAARSGRKKAEIVRLLLDEALKDILD